MDFHYQDTLIRIVWMAWSFEMQSHGFHTQVIEPTLRSITQMFKIEESKFMLVTLMP